MFRWIKEEEFYVDNDDDLIRSIGINGYEPMSFIF